MTLNALTHSLLFSSSFLEILFVLLIIMDVKLMINDKKLTLLLSVEIGGV